MSKQTQHGQNIADQITDEDAYGGRGTLTLADVFFIVDMLHTHFLDTHQDTQFLERWMDELREMDDEI